MAPAVQGFITLINYLASTQASDDWEELRVAEGKDNLENRISVSLTGSVKGVDMHMLYKSDEEETSWCKTTSARHFSSSLTQVVVCFQILQIVIFSFPQAVQF